MPLHNKAIKVFLSIINVLSSKIFFLIIASLLILFCFFSLLVPQLSSSNDIVGQNSTAFIQVISLIQLNAIFQSYFMIILFALLYIGLVISCIKSVFCKCSISATDVIHLAIIITLSGFILNLSCWSWNENYEVLISPNEKITVPKSNVILQLEMITFNSHNQPLSVVCVHTSSQNGFETELGVNKPLKVSGYYLHQVGIYDNNSLIWNVSRYPFDWLINSGFIMIVLGMIIWVFESNYPKSLKKD